jgi:hypothetical protein
MAPIPLVDKPQFWIAFALAESSIPIMIPNKRWMGAVMFALALLFYASAAEWLPDAWIPEPWQRRNLIIGALTGLAVIVFSAAMLIWLVRRLRNSRDGLIDKAASEEVPPMRDSITVTNNSYREQGAAFALLKIRTDSRNIWLERTNGQVEKLVFTHPRSWIVTKNDLPATVPIGEGFLIVKDFAPDGIWFQDKQTKGELIEAEMYFRRDFNQWEPLTPQRLASLASQLSAMTEPRGTIHIVRDDLLDCVHWADQLHNRFSQSGWHVPVVGSPFYGQEPGIRVRFKPDDTAAVEVRDILSDIFGFKVGKLIERAENMDWFEIQIGRKPP